MKRNNDLIIWNPEELIYEIGSPPHEAYLITEGNVKIETNLHKYRTGMLRPFFLVLVAGFASHPFYV